MTTIIDKIKAWFGRQERRTVEAAEDFKEFDATTDRLGGHKDHMIDRIEDNRPDPDR